MQKNPEKKGKGRKMLWLRYGGIVLIIIALILVVLFFMQGETKTTGKYPEPEHASSISCKKVDFIYPFFEYDNGSKRAIEINAILNNDNLSKIALTYTINYDNENEIIRSEAVNHAAMNKSFADDNLGQDLFNSDYSILSDSLQYTISAGSDAIYNHGGKKYFLLDGANTPPYSSDTIKQIYQQKGFDCTQR